MFTYVDLFVSWLFCCFPTPQPQQLKVLSHSSFVGSLFAICQLSIMARDNAVALLRSSKQRLIG
jgi:hypothetical protein